MCPKSHLWRSVGVAFPGRVDRVGLMGFSEHSTGVVPQMSGTGECRPRLPSRVGKDIQG